MTSPFARQSAGNRSDLLSALMLEYGQLKAEQLSRIDRRDNLIYATLTATAAVILGAVQHSPLLLLALPLAGVLLGWTYLSNDVMITSIGRYIRTELDPRVAELTGSPVPVFGWEQGHSVDPHRTVRRSLTLARNLIAFVVPGITGSAMILANGKVPVWADGVALFLSVVVSVFAWQLAAHAEIATGGRR